METQEEKIYSISNYIYNRIKREFSPSGIQIDYTSVKSVWTSLIGYKVTLSQLEFNELNRKCVIISFLLEKVGYIIDVIRSLNNEQRAHYINVNAGLFDMYLDDFNFVFDELNTYIKYLQSKTIIDSQLKQEKERVTKGTKWVNTLFSFYLKYNGDRYVSASDFFYYIKSIWDKIDVYETIEISHITENILGGISILNISYNLRDWLIKNKDVIKSEYKDIINVCLDISPLIIPVKEPLINVGDNLIEYIVIN